MQLQRQMYFDFQQNNFDTTLQRYTVASQIKPISNQILYKEPTLIDLWNKFQATLNHNSAIEAVRRVIIRYAGKSLAGDSEWFEKLASEYSPSSYQVRRSYLASCLQWGITEGIYQGKNPYKSKKLKGNKDSERKIQPFTQEEITGIIEALKTNQFTRSEEINHQDYLLFVQFLFATGCRLGEAIALKWNKIDFKNKQVLIDCAVRKDNYTGEDIWSKTKTKNAGWIPLNNSILKLLEAEREKRWKDNGDSLVFNVHGHRIDLERFRNRVWKPILAGLGIEYRYPYQCRHTVLSVIAKTGDLPLAAKVARHKDLTMVMRHYGKHVGEVTLPDLLHTSENN